MAAWSMKVRLEGLQEAFAALEGLKRGLRNRILRLALNEATAPMLKAAKDRAVKGKWSGSGLLKKSIGRRTKTYRRSGSVIVIIGPRVEGFRKQHTYKPEHIFREFGGKGGVSRTRRIKKPRPDQLRVMRNPVHYAHFVERGTYKRAAKPFLRPAFTATKSQAEAIFKRRVGQEVLRLAVNRRP
jgi:HK97 gp10 family phage protein